MVTSAVLLILSTVLEMNPEYVHTDTKIVFDVLRVAFAGETNAQVEAVFNIIFHSFSFSSEVRVRRKLVAR